MSFVRSKTWIDIPKHMSISELMERGSASIPADKIIYEEAFTGNTVSYGRFRHDVRTSASWLRESMGLQPGQTVAISGSSCINYVLAVHAVWWAGGVASLINDSLHASEVSKALDIVRPDLILVGNDEVDEKMKACLAQSACYGSGPKPAVRSFDQLARAASATTTELEPHSLGERSSHDVLCAILLSSGTTGKPKAVMMSHRNMVAAIMQLRADNPANWRQSQREIFFPPLSHVYAVYVVMTGAFWIGSYVCLMPRFNLDRYCRLMSSRKATLARLVPPIAKRLADEKDVVGRYRYPHLEYFSCSAAPLKADVAASLQKAFPHVALCQTYGATELSGPCVQSGTRDTTRPLMAAGTIIANTDLVFFDEDSGAFNSTGPGEIVVKGPNVMMGYKDDPRASSESLLEGGWYRTGDLGYIDENGFIFIYDRLKDIVKYNGFQVSPLELEEILLQHPLVDEAAVCGIWSEAHASDIVRAYIIPKDRTAIAGNLQAAADTLSNFVADRVSSYKRLIGGVVFVDQLPKNPTGKVLRRVLRSNAEAKTTQPVMARL